jgi:phosphatidylinositol glycan class A protein
VRGHIFLNASLTESFGIALVEAACAGLFVVSTRVGGVPEVLPADLVAFARPDADDVLRACATAIAHVRGGTHDPHAAHARVRGFYGWERVGARTEKVYEAVVASPQRSFQERMTRFVLE